MLFRYATTAGISIDGREKNLSGFVDRYGISPGADELMEWAVATGLIDGKPGNRLGFRASPPGLRWLYCSGLQRTFPITHPVI